MVSLQTIKLTASNRGRLALFLIATMFAFTMMMSSLASVSATSHGQSFEFTQSELDDNWDGDRRFPTDGATSVNDFGREDVARIGVDSEQTAPGGFQRTEGIKTTPAQNFGDTVTVDLYMDPDWQDSAVRAGLWVVGDDGNEARDELFGIIEFVNSEDCEEGNCTGTHPTNRPNHEGFRIWDSTVGGWTEELDTPFNYGEWVTLSIELDADAEEYKYFINGDLVGSATSGSNHIREVFLNSYNYGEDTFPTLNSNSYAAHWHGGLAGPTDKNECKKGGFAAFGFSNQGQCIRFVNTGQDSR
jgi:hypothetical protein